jgi:hypothetical protein
MVDHGNMFERATFARTFETVNQYRLLWHAVGCLIEPDAEDRLDEPKLSESVVIVDRSESSAPAIRRRLGKRSGGAASSRSESVPRSRQSSMIASRRRSRNIHCIEMEELKCNCYTEQLTQEGARAPVFPARTPTTACNAGSLATA